MKVAWKLCLGFSLVIGIMMVSTLIIHYKSNQTITESERFTDDFLPLALTAADMKLQAIQIQQWLTDVSATHNRDGYKEADDAVAAFMAGKKKFQRFFEAHNDARSLQELSAIETAMHTLYADGKAMAEAYINEGLDAGNERMEHVDAASAALAESLDPFIAAQTRLADQSARDMQRPLQASSAGSRRAGGRDIDPPAHAPVGSGTG